MTRPLLIDSAMINNDLDMLECRLYELGDVVDWFVIVEADVDHQDHPKPYHLSDNIERFSQWADKLVVVQAKNLPTVEEDADPWAREHAQREWVHEGLRMIAAPADAVIMHGDIDEIPTTLVARNLRPNGLVSLTQRGHFWSLRWLYPQPWHGTVAGRVGSIGSFGAMRDTRNIAPKIPNAGWHLSWLGGPEAATAKVGSFCHPEVEERITSGLASNRFLEAGYHVDGEKMQRVEIDETYPRWVRDGKCPASWLL
jgi:beta-1,4-mannosyl-glycoprotein beta-1,4-N-acetylglucosaminyltransferase